MLLAEMVLISNYTLRAWPWIVFSPSVFFNPLNYVFFNYIF